MVVTSWDVMWKNIVRPHVDSEEEKNTNVYWWCLTWIPGCRAKAFVLCIYHYNSKRHHNRMIKIIKFPKNLFTLIPDSSSLRTTLITLWFCSTWLSHLLWPNLQNFPDTGSNFLLQSISYKCSIKAHSFSKFKLEQAINKL